MMLKVDKADNSVAMGTAAGDCKAEAEKFLLVVCQVEPTRPRIHAPVHPCAIYLPWSCLSPASAHTG